MSRSSLFCAVAILIRAVVMHLLPRGENAAPELPRPESRPWPNPIPQSEQ